MSSRDLTLDLTIGLGPYRWGDDKAAILATFPDAVWGKVEPVYAFKKAFDIAEFPLTSALVARAIVDPDSGTAEVVRINVPEDQWPALADVVRTLGATDVPATLTGDDVLAWTSETVEFEVAQDFDLGGIYLRAERPLAADRPDEAVNPLDDDENYDFGD